MSQNEGFVLTQDEKDILGEISNISMGSAATALSNILGQKVVITSPHVEKGSRQAIEDLEKIPSIGVIISYTEGVIGENFLIMRSADAAQIVNLLMGGDVESEEFGEIQISAIAEVMNQMMGGSATALSGFIGRTVNISPPSAFVLTEENKEEKLAFIYSQADQVVFVKFRFFVENMFESEIDLHGDDSRFSTGACAGDARQNGHFQSFGNVGVCAGTAGRAAVGAAGP